MRVAGDAARRRRGTIALFAVAAVLSLTTACNADKDADPALPPTGSAADATAVPTDIASIMAAVESAADRADSDAAAGDGDG
ncbi:hypothetical protein [Yinghuangia soli]|uniref:Lipoprotein n=1 Tax=Yinghuangia soli TaxID=2908204 RepID=A0AA41U1R0_9ACTN|nr:hypothetical protein [Yinghuangia soli]MCF2530998.1 hypothetical protein [Yinghuangia soli]